MTLKKRLYIGVGAMLFVTVLILGIVLNMAEQMRTNMNEIVEDRYQKVSLATQIRFEVNNMSRGLSNLVLEKKPEAIQKVVDEIVQAHYNGSGSVETLSKLETQGKANKLVVDLKLTYEFYKDSSTDIVRLVRDGKNDEAIALLQGKNLTIRVELLKMIAALNSFQEERMAEALSSSQEMYNTMVKSAISFVVVALMVGVFITIWMTRTISRELNEVVYVMGDVPYGSTDQLPRLNVPQTEEIARIAIAFNEMADALEQRAQYEKEYNRAMQEQSWLKTRLAEVSTIFQGVQDLETLAQTVISNMTPLVGASYGVFYLVEDRGGTSYLRKTASYAGNGMDIGVPGFAFGHGLVGQAASENKIILLQEVPDDYIQIASGLGAASPASILVMPVTFEGDVVGVLELATFDGFSTLHRTLLEEVNDNIGVAIHRIIDHAKISKLLKEAQLMTEELQTQSEELQLQQEELITINEQLEEQYKKSERKGKELERARLALEEKTREVVLGSKYKSEFLANMSHELRTPLNSLLILSQMLAENNEGNLSDKQVEFAQTIHSSGHDLLSLINDVLDLSKIESGKMEIHPVVVDLEEIRSSIKRQFLPIARRQVLEFNVTIADGLMETFRTDEQRLQQVVKNLLSNAFKFTERGSVTLHMGAAAEEVLVDYPQLNSGEKVLAISVIDTGIGIPEDKQDVIFEAFRQADGTTSRRFGGTGLGLSICKEITHLLGGVIELNSVDGKGSTFTLYLPECTEPVESVEKGQANREVAAALVTEEMRAEVVTVQPVEPQTEQPSNLQPSNMRLDGKKVLVVDDDMRNVFALTTALESHQIKVVFAENGREGIEMLAEHPDIDIVLMDIMMPEMDGYEAMKMIRQNPQFEKLPIIALTAKAMKNDREKCIAAGASDYISKPVQLEQLFSLMRVWMYR